MRLLRALIRTLVVLAILASSAGAIPVDPEGAVPPARTPAPRTPDPLCEQSYANDAPRGGPRIHFGVGPRLAGETGSGNATPLVPENVRRRDAALRTLRGKKPFTVRLNRLFESDGARGIARFRAMARHYAALGLDVELQVRYHPADSDNGNLAAWLAFVRKVVAAFGPIRHVTALQITNEVNLTFSRNTSDGYYRRALPALIQGVIAAKRAAAERGYDQLRIGFNFAWGFGGHADADFWNAIGRAGPVFRRSLDWVGMDFYPGTYTPPAAAVRSYADAFREGLAQVRECYMPKGRLGRGFPLRIEETGWPTGPGRSEATQARVLRAFVSTADAYRGTYHVSDFRWFGLRDNNSEGPDFQSYFGLLRDDYSPKPAFAVYRSLVARYGASR